MKRFLFSLALVLSSIAATINSADYSINLVVGDEIQQVFPLYRDLYLIEFQNYPYLSVGNKEDVEDYINFLKEQKDTAVAVAFHNGEIIGFACGTSLLNFGEHFEGSIEIFKDAGLNPEDFYYIADAYVEKAHRGNFLSKKLVEEIEKHAKELNFKKIGFVIEEHKEHPLKPADYKELDAIAQRFGYTKTGLSTKFTWNTRLPDGQTGDQEHTLNYWIKDLQ